jgi:hypothetical protein
MPLSKEQKKDLDRLGQELRKLEQLAIENKLDLDVFMTSYSDEGYDIVANEKVSLEDQASRRKKVFEKAGKPKTEKAAKSR